MPLSYPRCKGASVKLCFAISGCEIISLEGICLMKLTYLAKTMLCYSPFIVCLLWKDSLSVKREEHQVAGF